ncbi:MAG: YitT family protein, partial [Petrimonas sp.]|uniref:YitT family protein n=1 Tax=Petrimonas sp. TaxID=2023866 RepID=UPI002B3D6D26|nr:YitT family protein [Petrimonas sp.]
MNLPTKKYLKVFEWRDYLLVVIGLVLYAIGLTGFLIPNKIVTGGLAGISLLINYSTGIPVWLSILVINCVLLVFAWFILGRKFVLKTLFGAFGLTFMIG